MTSGRNSQGKSQKEQKVQLTGQEGFHLGKQYVNRYFAILIDLNKLLKEYNHLASLH